MGPECRGRAQGEKLGDSRKRQIKQSQGWKTEEEKKKKVRIWEKFEPWWAVNTPEPILRESGTDKMVKIKFRR